MKQLYRHGESPEPPKAIRRFTFNDIDRPNEIPENFAQFETDHRNDIEDPTDWQERRDFMEKFLGENIQGPATIKLRQGSTVSLSRTHRRVAKKRLIPKLQNLKTFHHWQMGLKSLWMMNCEVHSETAMAMMKNSRKRAQAISRLSSKTFCLHSREKK